MYKDLVVYLIEEIKCGVCNICTTGCIHMYYMYYIMYLDQNTVCPVLQLSIPINPSVHHTL